MMPYTVAQRVLARGTPALCCPPAARSLVARPCIVSNARAAPSAACCPGLTSPLRQEIAAPRAMATSAFRARVFCVGTESEYCMNQTERPAHSPSPRRRRLHACGPVGGAATPRHATPPLIPLPPPPSPGPPPTQAGDHDTMELELKVEGMVCGGCSSRVEDALKVRRVC